MKNTDLLLDDLLGKAPPKTVNLDIRKLHPFEGHPFVLGRWKMMRTKLSPDTDDYTRAKRQELLQFLP